MLATHNRGKLAELQALLGGQVDAVCLADLGVPDDTVESGATLQDNARIKAHAARRRTGLTALADDSGLEVDVLDGAPGVHSARYGGEPRSDARNLAALLHALRDVPAERRSARFRCCLCLVAEDLEVLATGTLEGTVIQAPRGAAGFGYDPVFVPRPEEVLAAGLPPDRIGRTLAELSMADKNLLSHRGRALRRLQPVLLALAQASS